MGSVKSHMIVGAIYWRQNPTQSVLYMGTQNQGVYVVGMYETLLFGE